jgi:hypothetical protein
MSERASHAAVSRACVQGQPRDGVEPGGPLDAAVTLFSTLCCSFGIFASKFCCRLITDCTDCGRGAGGPPADK